MSDIALQRHKQYKGEAGFLPRLFDFSLGFAALVYLVWSFCDSLLPGQAYTPALVLLLANGCLSIFGAVRSIKMARPLFFIFFCFNYMFHAVAPLQKVGIGSDPILEHTDLLFEASCLSFVFILVGFLVFLARDLLPRPLVVNNKKRGWWNTTLLSSSSIFLLFLITGAWILILVSLYGRSLFSTREAIAEILIEPGLFSSPLQGLVAPFVVIASVTGFCIAYRQRDRVWVFLFSILILGAFAVNNPAITARYESSTLIAFFLLAIFGWWKVRMLAVFLIAGIVVSPILNSVFRYSAATRELYGFSPDSRHLRTFFSHMDYDALNIFEYTILWVRHHGTLYGANVLSAFFFFVPRSIWPGKTRHLGATIYSEIYRYAGHGGTDNLSSPPPAEGYLAFGFFGALMLSLFAVWLIDVVERRGSSAEPVSPWRLVLCVSPMIVMLFLRGPFVIGITVWAMHVAAIAIVAVILKLGGTTKSSQRQALPKG